MCLRVCVFVECVWFVVFVCGVCRVCERDVIVVYVRMCWVWGALVMCV